MSSAIMLTVSMRSVIVHCQYLDCHNAECHYAECRIVECHYTECHGTIRNTFFCHIRDVLTKIELIDLMDQSYKTYLSAVYEFS